MNTLVRASEMDAGSRPGHRNLLSANDSFCCGFNRSMQQTASTFQQVVSAFSVFQVWRFMPRITLHAQLKGVIE